MNQPNSQIENEAIFQRLGINTKTISFQRYYQAGLLNNVDEVFVQEVQEYWLRNYGKKVNPSLHLAFLNLTGKKEPRIIPWSHRNEIIYFFNDLNVQPGYNDKNIFDKLINAPSSVEIVIKRVRGNYFDADNHQIAPERVMSLLFNSNSDLIAKPSKTDDGIGIEKLQRKNGHMYLGGTPVDLLYLEEMYGSNFIVQKIIKQHPVMAAPHPHSVNTLRMVTFRWDNEIRNLLTFARFGADGAITDNAGTGGLCCGVNDSGEFMNFAINKQAISFSHHPTSGYPFATAARVPNYKEFKEFVINLHMDILHHDFVSWDIAVGIDGKPIFLEANFRGGATWVYQLATQRAIFGELTEDILQYVSSQLRRNRFIRDTGPAILRQSSQKTSKKIIVQGLFQGSGYCKWIKGQATELNLDGYCKELKDGSLEVVVAGDDESAISEFKGRLANVPDQTYVEGITVQSWDKPVPPGFEIRPDGYMTINKLKERVRMQKQALEKRKKQIDALTEQGEQNTIKLQTLEKSIKDKQEAVQRFKSRVQSLKGTLQEKEEELKQMKADYKEKRECMQQRWKALNTKVQEKEEELKQMKAGYKEKREDMRQRCKALNVNLQEKKEELLKAKERYQDMKKGREMANRRVQELSLKLQNREDKLKLTKRKYKKIKRSRIWRYTAPLRKIGTFFSRG